MIYGCDGGNCGKCLSRLVSGVIQRIHHSDFILNPTQKDNNQFLSCCYAATSDVEMEAIEIGNVNEIPEQSIQVRVSKLKLLSKTVMSVVFKTPRSQPLSFLSGQYVSVSINGNLSSNQSLASCHCDGLNLEIHVKYRPHDPFSEYVFQQLKKHEQVEINGPRGDFVMNDESIRPLVFIAFDTGFASIKSLLEHAIALEKVQPIKLYWIVMADEQPYLDNYCRSLVDALDNFSYSAKHIPLHSPIAHKRVMEKIIARETSLKQSDIYLSLPEEFRRMAQEMFIHAELDERHWSIDSIPILLANG